jgi:NAD(P)-dependent dehydrogenase (short-subunit alcohol dehydrogenase family)
LAGKVAIITGSAKPTGIGAGIAMTLARAGARVVINHVSNSSAEDAANIAERIKISTNRQDSAIVVRADIGSPEGAKSLVDGALKGLGVDHIDIIG